MTTNFCTYCLPDILTLTIKVPGLKSDVKSDNCLPSKRTVLFKSNLLLRSVIFIITPLGEIFIKVKLILKLAFVSAVVTMTSTKLIDSMPIN